MKTFAAREGCLCINNKNLREGLKLMFVRSMTARGNVSACYVKAITHRARKPSAKHTEINTYIHK